MFETTAVLSLYHCQAKFILVWHSSSMILEQAKGVWLFFSCAVVLVTKESFHMPNSYNILSDQIKAFIIYYFLISFQSWTNFFSEKKKKKMLFSGCKLTLGTLVQGFKTSQIVPEFHRLRDYMYLVTVITVISLWQTTLKELYVTIIILGHFFDSPNYG